MDFDALNKKLSDTSKCRWFDEGSWWNGNIDGAECGAPATCISCVPLIDTPTCDAHKCRCAKPRPTPNAGGEPCAAPTT